MIERGPVRKAYTEAQVRAAFYAEFYGAGELWFPYPEMGQSKKECHEAVKERWATFVERLRGE